jgi:quercetin dioxygenase-like cupin family protein
MKIFTGNSNVERAENLIEGANQTVTHLVLHKDTEIPVHQVKFSAIVVPIKGHVLFSDEERTEEIYPGKIVQLKPGEHHGLKGIEDAELMVVKMVLAE